MKIRHDSSQTSRHARSLHAILMAVIAAAPLLLCPSLKAQAQESRFALHDGDRVVFFGDSITAQRLYTTYLQTAVHAHFPEWKIQFYNAGVGGDNVHGGVAGKIDVRIDRDILRFRPTVVSIMLGMNDRSHPAEYEAGYEHILQRLHDEVPGLRLTVLGPTPMDAITAGKGTDNAELHEFLEIDRRLAGRFHATFIDLQTPVLAAMERAEKLNHLAATSLIPDRIHPQSPIHMLMAETILSGWNYPKTSSILSIEAVTGRELRRDGIDIRDLGKRDRGLEWTALEKADEIRFVSTDGNEVLYRELLGADHLGAKILQIKSLVPGRYTLLIDGKPMPMTWSEEQLDAGIRLDQLETPTHRAGVAVYYACSDSELNQTEYNRLVGTLAGQIPDLAEKADALLHISMDRSEKQIGAASKRTQHHFELRAVP